MANGRHMRWPEVAALLIAAKVGLLVLTAPSEAQRRVPPPSREAVQFSFAPIVKRAAPAVVNVYVRARVQTTVPPMFDDPFFRHFFGERFGMPRERVENSLGSGVIVSPEGIVVTNNHVIRGGAAAEIRVALADRREFDAMVILQDEKTDIAVLRLESNGAEFPTLEFADSDALEVGDMVLAIGNPFGVGQTVTSGIVSALARTEVARSDAQLFIQTDAAINPGNSGGALVDMNGRLVGINTAIYSRTGGSLGIGFAIPANLVRLYVDSALSGRKIERPWLGAHLEPVTREIADSLGLSRIAGVLVTRVSPKGPAAAAGLEPGDIVVAVDDFDVTDTRSLHYRLVTRGVGSSARLEVLRKGQRIRVDISLKAPPPVGRDDVRNLSGQNPFDGARVANLVPAVAEELGVEEQEGVVVVLSVRPGSTAAKVFEPGDIVVRVGREAIENVAQLERVLRERQRVWQIVFKRGERLLQLQIGG
jgi:Do/DeqQ family serine protease